ncbi:hypothetical protein FJD32_025390 (plasmid) [Shewanella sp. LC6]|uniref:hypothetical protein n=1 Tax=unclassified Shewanella TaxID=196818 RepID=UPI00112BA815|nr:MULTISPECIES: hypothetical protein [unclassified Shewanella]QQK62703.1 hypothetical protein FJD32_025390 [Shewanella sp. LC6]TPE64063.1 hypothetical protein FJD33_02860 [Shewanella sp. LC2]
MEFVKCPSIYLESYNLNSESYNLFLNLQGKIPDILDNESKIPNIYENTMDTGKGEIDMWWGAVVINLCIRAANPHVWTVPTPKSHRKTT